MAMQARRPPEYVATHDLAPSDGHQSEDGCDDGFPATVTVDAAASIGSTIADVMSGSVAHGAAATPAQPSAVALEAAQSFTAAGPRLKSQPPAS